MKLLSKKMTSSDVCFRNKSASTGSRKKASDSECVGKIQLPGRRDQLAVGGKEGERGKMAPCCPIGGTERAVGASGTQVYRQEFTFHIPHI